MSTRCAAKLAVLLAAAGALASCGGGSSKSSTGVQGKSEVTAEPVSSAGANPFTAAAGTDTTGVKPPAGTAGQTGPATYRGGMPGLYGGTRNHHSCDAEKLITFLEQNPGKAAAWARTLGIPTSQIRDYVTGLTAVTLRTDTRVTNHGYVNGTANPIQAVLEAGTAVFVDRHGRPVVKCYCGNPLTPPELLSSPTYTGQRWSDFEPAHITIIETSITIINVFTIYDLSTGKLYTKTPGANGTDGPYLGAPSSGPTTTPTQPPAPAQSPTHTATTEPSTTCPQGEVPDPSSSDGCSPTGTDGTTTPVCPDAGPSVCGDTSTGTSTHQSTGDSGSSGQSP